MFNKGSQQTGKGSRQNPAETTSSKVSLSLLYLVKEICYQTFSSDQERMGHSLNIRTLNQVPYHPFKMEILCSAISVMATNY